MAPTGVSGSCRGLCLAAAADLMGLLGSFYWILLFPFSSGMNHLGTVSFTKSAPAEAGGGALRTVPVVLDLIPSQQITPTIPMLCSLSTNQHWPVFHFTKLNLLDLFSLLIHTRAASQTCASERFVMFSLSLHELRPRARTR